MHIAYTPVCQAINLDSRKVLLHTPTTIQTTSFLTHFSNE